MQQIITQPGQLGHVLTARRKAFKLSQQAVAAQLDLSQNRLSELEENPARLTLDRLIALANILGLELVVQDKSPTAHFQQEW